MIKNLVRGMLLAGVVSMAGGIVGGIMMVADPKPHPAPGPTDPSPPGPTSPLPPQPIPLPPKPPVSPAPPLLQTGFPAV
ncbi:MAG TPA: hypothetical protein VKP13_14690 [Nitrospira sp.]|nr:hypothetical protein [Nitrospira sp.]